MRATNLLVGVATFLSTAGQLQAGLMTFSTSDSPFIPGTDNQGWLSPTSSNRASNSNYYTGVANGHDLRSFFTFDLSSLEATDTITSATLRLTRYASSPNNEPIETLGFYAVSTGADELNNAGGSPDAAIVAIYNDLGSGTSYGSFDVPGLGGGVVGHHLTVLEFDLNAAAVADANAARGGFFSIGATLLSQDGNDALFSSSHSDRTQDLVLNVESSASAVPEPSSLALFGLGTLGMAVVGARRRRDQKPETASQDHR